MPRPSEIERLVLALDEEIAGRRRLLSELAGVNSGSGRDIFPLLDDDEPERSAQATPTAKERSQDDPRFVEEELRRLLGL